MEKKVLNAIFTAWTEEENYSRSSAVENEIYKEHTNRIKDATKGMLYSKIQDDIDHLACAAEYAGFENGLRYGIMFMSGMLKGGAVHG